MSELSPAAPLKPLKTWSHLAGQRKRPSEYEIVSVNTLFTTGDPDVALELSPDLPMNQWYRRYRKGSRLQHPDWNAFRDPDALTYRAYCTHREKDEVYVDGLLNQYNELGHDRGLPSHWVDQLAKLYTPLRFLFHTLQMASAYQVTMAPASTIANCFAFQMADQFRWVSRIAYRTAELRKSWAESGIGVSEREQWERAAARRGLREMMEGLLATYDWSESLLVLQLVVLPAIDRALGELRSTALDHGDTLCAFLIDAQFHSSERQTRWTSALKEFIVAKEGNSTFLAEVVERWQLVADGAVSSYVAALREPRRRLS